MPTTWTKTRTPAPLLLAILLGAAGCSDDAGTTTGSGGAASTGTTASGGSGGQDAGPGVTIGSGGAGGTSGAGGEGAANAIDIPLEQFCAGEGSIPVPGGSADAPCFEDLAKKTFKFALCSCTDITVGNYLETSAFDSNTDAGLLAGSVGANRDLVVSNSFDVQGAVWVGGETTVGNSATVAQNLRTGGAADFLHLQAGRHAYAATDASTQDGALTGDLHVPQGVAFDGLDVGGEVIVGPVSVPEPCDCETPVPFGAIVDAFEAKNDNEELGIPFSYDDTSVDVELPCGRFFFTGLHAGNSISLHLTGRTVIAVDGDITASNTLQITLAEGASLDLFVDGDIVLGNSAVIGDRERPVATRIYTSGDGISLGNSIILGGNIYMPNSPLELGNGALVSGALFAREITVGNTAMVSYDAAILDLDGCKEPPSGGCDDCGDCGNPTPACNGGECGACTTDADCCGPTVCLADGSCAYAGPN